MKIKFLFVTLFVLNFNLSSCQKSIKANNISTERVLYLEGFYSEYISSWENPDNDMLSTLKKYCSSNLFDNIINMWKTHQLDHDPFINTQDVSAIILDYLKVTPIEGERELFEVSFRYPVQKESERTRIKLKVVCTKDGYKIDGVGEIQGNPPLPHEPSLPHD